MSIFPQLEQAIADAARQRYGTTRRTIALRTARRLMPAVAACALLVGLAAVVLSLDHAGTDLDVPAPTQEMPLVPDATLVASAALTRAPAVRPPGADGVRPEPIADRDLISVGQEIRAQVPFPPGASDSVDWLKSGSDMAQIDYRADVQAVMEFRAGCQWLGFWLRAKDAGAHEAASRALTVLADIARWPTMRGARTRDATDRWAELAQLARGGDVAAVRADEARNCDVKN